MTIQPRLCTSNSKYPVLAKNDILGSRLIACCNLAPTLATQIWRHNYVISRNEYLISTLSESTFSLVYSLQFLFKSTHQSWRYERKCEWVFSEHSVEVTLGCHVHLSLISSVSLLSSYRSASHCKLPSGVCSRAPAKIDFGAFHFSLKTWHLVTTIFTRATLC